MRALCGAVALLMSFGPAVTGVSAAEIADLKNAGTFVGICEPSGVVAYPPGTVDQFFIVGNDEDNILRTYRVSDGLNASPDSVPKTDMNEFLELNAKDEDDKVDIEGATYLDGRALWLGSHSRSRKGHKRPSRWRLFSTRIEVKNGIPSAVPEQKAVTDALLQAFTALPLITDSISIKTKTAPKLAAKQQGGFNIEGLTIGDDGSSIWIGLRSPLTDKGEAIVVHVRNPNRVLAGGKADLDPSPVPLDLVMLGIRSIEYSPAAKTYLILAGASGDDAKTPIFELYTWDGQRDSKPVRVEGLRERLTAAGLQNFQPEAMVVDDAGKRLLILSDDGGRCPANKAFRGALVTLR